MRASSASSAPRASTCSRTTTETAWRKSCWRVTRSAHGEVTEASPSSRFASSTEGSSRRRTGRRAVQNFLASRLGPLVGLLTSKRAFGTGNGRRLRARHPAERGARRRALDPAPTCKRSPRPSSTHRVHGRASAVIARAGSTSSLGRTSLCASSTARSTPCRAPISPRVTGSWSLTQKWSISRMSATTLRLRIPPRVLRAFLAFHERLRAT